MVGDHFSREISDHRDAEVELRKALILCSKDADWINRRVEDLNDAAGPTCGLIRKAVILRAIAKVVGEIGSGRASVRHDPAKMAFVERFPKKTKPTPSFRNGKNYWQNMYRCPTCGTSCSRLSNATKDRDVWCDGLEQVAKKRPA